MDDSNKIKEDKIDQQQTDQPNEDRDDGLTVDSNEDTNAETVDTSPDDSVTEAATDSPKAEEPTPQTSDETADEPSSSETKTGQKDITDKKEEDSHHEPSEEDKKKNVVDKTMIIDELRLLIKKEKEAGPAFDEFNALRERWHNSGHVNPADEKAMQHDFNILVDEFYYNAKIYRELREYSLEKNLDLKNELISKIESLVNIDSIKQIEYHIRRYQKEWSNIGPTVQDKWPEIRNRYYETVNKVYEKIHEHYDEVKKQHDEVYAEKQALIKEVNEIIKLDLKSFKDWQKNTDKVLEVQQKWKKTGFLNKKQNEECWKEFKNACDDFFNKKKEFFDQSKAIQQQNKEEKKKLIEIAEEIKDSEEWKETTEKFIELQNSWKKIGAANRSDEQKLWKRFKGTCDHFFNAKRDYFATFDERRKENVKLKEDLIKEISEYVSSGNQEQDLETLKEFTIRWKGIGQVPASSIDKVNQAYNKAMSKIYSSLDMDKHERDILKFKHKLDGYKDSNKREDLFRKERIQMKDKISKTESDLYSLEDKMGFFKNTNHANPLRDELEKKIKAQKELLDDLKEKYKLIPKS